MITSGAAKGRERSHKTVSVGTCTDSEIKGRYRVQQNRNFITRGKASLCALREGYRSQHIHTLEHRCPCTQVAQILIFISGSGLVNRQLQN